MIIDTEEFFNTAENFFNTNQSGKSLILYDRVFNRNTSRVFIKAPLYIFGESLIVYPFQSVIIHDNVNYSIYAGSSLDDYHLFHKRNVLMIGTDKSELIRKAEYFKLLG